MPDETFYFHSSDKIHDIHAVVWMPACEPVGIIQLVHGMVEYIERYDEFARMLNKDGFVVVGHDHLGHGDSVNGNKDDYGYIADKNPDVVLINDIQRLRRIMCKRYPKLPYYMFGHSMGSYLLRRFLTKYGAGIRGVIIAGTGRISDAESVAALAIVEAIALIKGWRYRSKFVRNLTYTGSYQKFDLKGYDTKKSWLTRDEEQVKKYYCDEKCTFTFTLNAYKALIRTTFFDNHITDVRKIPKDIQILFISGTDDPVGDLGKGVNLVYDMFCRAGILDVTLKLFEGARHELVNETNKEEVFEYVSAWLNKVNRKRR